MGLEIIVRLLRSPLTLFRQTTGRTRGELRQLKNMPAEYKREAAQLKAAKKATKNAKKAAAMASGGKPKKKKSWSLFKKVKTCPTCQRKQHSSWDTCPYCARQPAAATARPAAAAAAMSPALSAPAAAGPARTMALDLRGAKGEPVKNIGWLVPLEGLQAGELFQLGARAVVGTAPDCDVVLVEASISSRHVEMVATAGGYRLTDLGSTNGTYVNDKRINTYELVDNDNVRLGLTNFKFKSMN